MSGWLEALLGKVLNSGVNIPLSKGLNFTGGLSATLNPATKIIDVTFDGDVDGPAGTDLEVQSDGETVGTGVDTLNLVGFDVSVDGSAVTIVQRPHEYEIEIASTTTWADFDLAAACPGIKSGDMVRLNLLAALTIDSVIPPDTGDEEESGFQFVFGIGQNVGGFLLTITDRDNGATGTAANKFRTPLDPVPGSPTNFTITSEEAWFSFGYTKLSTIWRVLSHPAAKGDTGDTGPEGPAGDDGDTGPVGATGATGSLFYKRTVYAAGTSGTHVCDAAATRVRAVGVAGGGAGAGADGTAGNTEIGSGGSAGGAFDKAFTVAGGASITYAVGVGGTGVADASGNDGTDTTLAHVASGTSCTAVKGVGGNPSNAGATVLSVGGSAGGTATGGDVNCQGGPPGLGLRMGAAAGQGGTGGNSIFGGGGIGGRVIAAGQAAGGAGGAPGAGGGGAASADTGTAVAGGNGAGGVVIIEEFGT